MRGATYTKIGLSAHWIAFSAHHPLIPMMKNTKLSTTRGGRRPPILGRAQSYVLAPRGAVGCPGWHVRWVMLRTRRAVPQRYRSPRRGLGCCCCCCGRAAVDRLLHAVDSGLWRGSDLTCMLTVMQQISGRAYVQCPPSPPTCIRCQPANVEVNHGKPHQLRLPVSQQILTKRAESLILMSTTVGLSRGKVGPFLSGSVPTEKCMGNCRRAIGVPCISSGFRQLPLNRRENTLGLL
jgi:hypothetical protein